MATRLDTLITHVRSATENQEVSSSVGIPDAEFIRYFNEAQDHIVAKIIQQHKYVFGQEVIIPIVRSQEAYDVPDEAFVKNKLLYVEYSDDGNPDNYFPLRSKTLLERYSFGSGVPNRYVLRNGQILLSPIPMSLGASLRVNYIKRPCDLDVRRGSVSAVTLDPSTNTITSLTLTITSDNVSEFNLNEDHITIIDRLGNIKMKGVLADSTGITGAGPTYTFNVDSSFVYQDGESISVGNYIVFGEFASSHHQLDDQVERFLTTWVMWKIYKRDVAAQNTQDIERELNILEQDIIESYANIEDGMVTSPIIYNWEGWEDFN